jgi:ATPase family associated with various cellular activities (AAA)
MDLSLSAPMTAPAWTSTCPAYLDVHQPLAEAMARLDLQLRRELLRNPLRDPTDLMRFAAVSDEEVQGLLAPPGEATDGSPLQELDEAIAALEIRIRERGAATAAAGKATPLARLTRWFGLSAQEVDILIVCLAAELDRKYERIYGYLQDDMSRRRPSVGLALAVSCVAERQRRTTRGLLLPDAPLVAHRLVEVVDSAAEASPFPARELRVSERIARFLMGSDAFDARLADRLSWAPTGPAIDLDRELIDRVLAWVQSGAAHGRPAPAIYLHGPAGANKMRLASALCARLGVRLLRVDARALAAAPPGLEQGAAVALREGLLQGAAVLIDNLDRALEEDPFGARQRALMRILDERRERVAFLAGERPWTWPDAPGLAPLLPVELSRPGHAEELAVWRQALAGEALSNAEVSGLASLHPLPLPRALTAVHLARSTASLRGAAAISVEDVARGCREQSQPHMGRLARRVEGVHGWNDLVVPPPTLQELRDICAQARYRCQVFGEWGFGGKLALGRGLTVLFAGPSGTGKTMSAQLVAGDLGLELFAIDLSQVVSKYIGETEKNLHEIFAAAEAGNAVLFFDEADALLGKRSDVKDAHDRYANIEVAYLLQKIEEYRGITVLATNLRRNIDEAFARRIRFIVEFPVPDENHRLRIWKGIWPGQTPLADDVDLALLARQYELVGGNIRNVALSAAFLAAQEGQPVGMRHLQITAKRELRKIGRLVDPEAG